jgi:hypothetical protein
LKNQGSILYLIGYLFYIYSQPHLGKLPVGLICLALVSFVISLLASWSCRAEKNPSTLLFKKQLEAAAESAGSLLTILFAVTFIPKAHFIETHLALFGLLVLTFLATRNILPGAARDEDGPENIAADHHSAVSLPINK